MAHARTETAQENDKGSQNAVADERPAFGGSQLACGNERPTFGGRHLAFGNRVRPFGNTSWPFGGAHPAFDSSWLSSELGTWSSKTAIMTSDGVLGQLRCAHKSSLSAPCSLGSARTSPASARRSALCLAAKPDRRCDRGSSFAHRGARPRAALTRPSTCTHGRGRRAWPRRAPGPSRGRVRPASSRRSGTSRPRSSS